MTSDLDVVVLTEAVPQFGLKEGDVGTVVETFRLGEAFEVEFITLKGETVALVTLKPDQFRPVGKYDMLHVRKTKLPLVA